MHSTSALVLIVIYDIQEIPCVKERSYPQITELCALCPIIQNIANCAHA